jgi:hypothetical protein
MSESCFAKLCDVVAGVYLNKIKEKKKENAEEEEQT